MRIEEKKMNARTSGNEMRSDVGPIDYLSNTYTYLYNSRDFYSFRTLNMNILYNMHKTIIAVQINFDEWAIASRIFRE